MIVNNGVIKFSLPTKNTWLGAFSYLQLRGRLSVESAVEFKQLQLTKGDFVFLFTDGVDQCIYEKDSISFNYIARQTKDNKNVEEIFDKIIKRVFQIGAEDNASLAIIKF